MSSKIGPNIHLTWKEIACKDGTGYPDKWKGNRLFELIQMFESVRRLYGKPITILSAYRTVVYNRKIGGALNSQHVQGRALDIKPPKGISVQQLYDAIKAEIEWIGVTGLGKYSTYLHIDCRPSTGRIAYWTGK